MLRFRVREVLILTLGCGRRWVRRRPVGLVRRLDVAEPGNALPRRPDLQRAPGSATAVVAAGGKSSWLSVVRRRTARGGGIGGGLLQRLCRGHTVYFRFQRRYREGALPPPLTLHCADEILRSRPTAFLAANGCWSRSPLREKHKMVSVSELLLNFKPFEFQKNSVILN